MVKKKKYVQYVLTREQLLEVLRVEAHFHRHTNGWYHVPPKKYFSKHTPMCGTDRCFHRVVQRKDV